MQLKNKRINKIALAAVLLLLISFINVPVTNTTIMPLTIVTAKTKRAYHKRPARKRKYQVPQVNTFDQPILKEYYLLGIRWSSRVVTYNIDDLTKKEQKVAKSTVNQVNALKIVKLNRSHKKADITFIKDSTPLKYRLGLTSYACMPYASYSTYKNLNYFDYAKIYLYMKNINKYKKHQLLLNMVILHELGHSLGLDHMPQTNYHVMAPNIDETEVPLQDIKHMKIDQNYINGLAILYLN